MAGASKLSPEVRETAGRMVREHTYEYASQWEAIRSIAAKVGCLAEVLRKRDQRSEIDSGHRPVIPSDERKRIVELEHVNFEPCVPACAFPTFRQSDVMLQYARVGQLGPLLVRENWRA